MSKSYFQRVQECEWQGDAMSIYAAEGIASEADSEVHELNTKIAALQAECAAFYQAAGDAQVERDAARDERDAIKAECDALRADAERYRFSKLRGNGSSIGIRRVTMDGSQWLFDTQADAAIDNERSKA